MKKFIFLFALLSMLPVMGFDFGVGFSWNTVNENFHSKLITNEDKSGQDHYETSANRFAPKAQIGHRFFLRNDWITGFLASWQYLNYQTQNENSSVGQILPNASFSSINIFGPQVIRDFTSKTRLKNEVILLWYFGKQIADGYAYLGLGPMFFNASNSLYVSSVHTPNGVGDHLISTSVTKDEIVWGGAAQVGYQYCLTPHSFLNFSYAYLQTGNNHFNNSVNAAILNGANNPGATTLFLRRKINFSNQEFTLSLNLEI